MGYVSRLSGNMQLFPPDLTVAGPCVLFDYDPAKLRELLGYMVPSNMVLVAIGREFKEKTDKVRGGEGGRSKEGKTFFLFLFFYYAQKIKGKSCQKQCFFVVLLFYFFAYGFFNNCTRICFCGVNIIF